MLLEPRSRTAFLVALVLWTGNAAAAKPGPTKAECIATSESAQDLRHSGRLRDARVQFELCNAATCPGPIREDCAQELDEIAAGLPSIIFEVKDGSGHDVDDVTITMDGQLIVATAGDAIELDPGEHMFTFAMKGQQNVEKRFVVAEGVKGRHELIVVDRGATTHRAMSGVERLEPTATPAKDEVSRSASGPLMVAWVSFGVGVSGAVLGIVAGVVAGGKHSTLAGECDNATGTCSPKYAGDLDAFHTWRTVSTVGYVVGAVGVASGVTLWLTAPKARDAKSARIWLGPASTGVAGTF